MLQRILIGLLVSVISFFSLTGAAASALRYEVYEQPERLPMFSLVDQDGRSFDHTALKGSWSMIFIGFTSCPDVCPYTLANLEAVRAQLGLRVMPDQLPKIALLAVDPERDKTHLKAYLDHFHGDFIGLTGEPKQIDVLVKGLRGYYRLDKSQPGQTDYTVTHSAAVAVVNPNLQVVASLSPPFHAHKAAEVIYRLMKGLPQDDQ